MVVLLNIGIAISSKTTVKDVALFLKILRKRENKRRDKFGRTNLGRSLETKRSSYNILQLIKALYKG